MSNPQSGRRRLKKYEVQNFLFFLVLIVALGVLVAFVFRYYGTRPTGPAEEADAGVVSDSVSPGSDVGMFYLGTKLAQTTHQYHSRLEIPVTDDGLIKDLFNLPGVDEVTLDQKIIVIRKAPSARWEAIQPGVRRIVKEHLHLHY